MPTLAMIAVLLAAPAATDRSASTVEVEVAPLAPEGPAPPPGSVEEPAAEPLAPPPPPPPPASSSRVVEPYESPSPVTRARPDRPLRWRVDLAGGIGTTLLRDTAWRAFDDHRNALQLSATIRADAPLAGGRVFLGGGATFRRFAGQGSVYSAAYTEARVRDPIAFVRASIVAVEGIDVVLQAGGGPSVVTLYVDSDTQFAGQRRVVGMVDGLGGVALYLPKRWLPGRGAARATAGIELGVGYTWRGKVDVRPSLPVGEEPIGTTSASLGDVALRGVTWRFGLFVRFM